jgi:TRAP-type C4-dicarboxylate transport system permease small subunit
MRRLLDRVYAGALALACLSMIAIAALVFAQIVGRLIDRALIVAGAEPLGLAIPSLTDFGAFLFVAAAMLALPAALRSAGHVRVTLALALAPPGVGRVLTGVVLVCALGLAGFAAWHAAAQALDSWRFDSVSYGMVKVPLWIPQGIMAVGLGLLAVAIADELVTALRGRTPAFRMAEEQRSRKGH